MRRSAREWWRQMVARFRRMERREIGDLRDWLEHTGNLLHLSVLVSLPVLIGFVTYLSNSVNLLPFLLFPPLAAGTYTLFAHPESRYAAPRRFVGGLTAGALCGWVALILTARFWYGVAPSTFEVDPWAAAFGVFLTGVVTWAFDIEESSAFSTALLVLVTGATQLEYVLSVALSTSIIAGIFVLWRRHFYHQRARYLYRSTWGDDRVLVPIRGPRATATAMFGARLAATHPGGRLSLLTIVEEESGPPPGADVPGQPAVLPLARIDGIEPQEVVADSPVGEAVAADLQAQASYLEAETGVPTEVIVVGATGERAVTVLAAARDADCDLIVVPYEGEEGRLSPFVKGLMGEHLDVIVHRSVAGRESWGSVLVPIRRAGDLAHAMIDFAGRLAESGRVSVYHCIATEGERRAAEEMLANLVETVQLGIETRIARAALPDFLARVADDYDLVIVGASTDRSAASRFVSPPSFEQLVDVECDVAIVHRD